MYSLPYELRKHAKEAPAGPAPTIKNSVSTFPLGLAFANGEASGAWELVRNEGAIVKRMHRVLSTSNQQDSETFNMIKRSLGIPAYSHVFTPLRHSDDLQ